MALLQKPPEVGDRPRGGQTRAAPLRLHEVGFCFGRLLPRELLALPIHKFTVVQPSALERIPLPKGVQETLHDSLSRGHGGCQGSNLFCSKRLAMI